MPLVFKDHRQHVDLLIKAAVKAADPMAAVRRNLHRKGSLLVVASDEYDLATGQLYLVAVGKAAPAMGTAAAEILGDLLTHGVLITKDQDGQSPESSLHLPALPDSVEFYEAGHPVSDQRGVDATAAAVRMLENTSDGDLVLCLISGGASALLTQPLLALSDWQHLVDALLGSGCTINELNAVRKKLDRVKGGGLARITAPAACVSLILSDVIGNPLDVIGSGPTVENPDKPATALQVLARYNMVNVLPSEMWRTIENHLTAVRFQKEEAESNARNLIVGDVRQAAEAAVAAATDLGFSSSLLTVHLEGEAREVGRVAAALAMDASPDSCLVLGGETTVTLKGNGLGGRNQELALAAALALDGQDNVVLASFATDGDDGPTDAAGAVVTGETVSRSRASGLDPIAFLDQNDSYGFFSQTEGLLKTGPTGTNVNDLIFILRYSGSHA